MTADASSVPRTELAAPKLPIPTCSPNLMPFHIQYSGPAPVSTYFRVKPSADPSRMTGTSSDAFKSDTQPITERVETTDSQQTLVADQPSLTPAASTSSMATITGDVEMQQTDGTENVELSGKHFVAAFRGRAIRGTKVDLPEGFAGIVLSASEAAQEKPAALAKAPEDNQRKTRPKRAVSKKKAAPVDEVEEEADAGMEESELSGPVRTLEAAGTFSSFVLWHPDIPADEGRDEYLRSLTEWTTIASEIHRYDD